MSGKGSSPFSGDDGEAPAAAGVADAADSRLVRDLFELSGLCGSVDDVTDMLLGLFSSFIYIISDKIWMINNIRM